MILDIRPTFSHASDSTNIAYHDISKGLTTFDDSEPSEELQKTHTEFQEKCSLEQVAIFLESFNCRSIS